MSSECFFTLLLYNNISKWGIGLWVVGDGELDFKFSMAIWLYGFMDISHQTIRIFSESAPVGRVNL